MVTIGEGTKTKMINTEQQQLKVLFKKHRKIIRNIKKISQFKEPALILIRLSNKVEFYENAIGTEFNYTHSNGEETKIILDRSQQLTFDYGPHTFKAYICHEDEAMPYPHRPILYAQTLQTLLDKIMNDIKNWKAKEWEAKGNMWWKIGMAIGGIILAIAMYKLLVPPQNITVLGSIAQNVTLPVG